MSSKKKQPKKEIAYERDNQVEQGFFDGRFAPKVVPNKKKEKRKKEKHKKQIRDYDTA